MCVSHRNPAEAWVRAKKQLSVNLPGANIRSEATSTLTSDEKTFAMNLALNVYLNENLYFHKQWSCTTPRQLL